MPLFRELPPDRQATVAADLTRREAVLREIFIDLGRRANLLLFLLLIGGVAASFAILMHSAGQSRLVIAALSCHLVGLLIVGLIFVLDHEILWRTTFQFAAYKSGMLKSEIDTESLNAFVKPSQKLKIPMYCGYAAFAFWIAGATLCLIAVASGSPRIGFDHRNADLAATSRAAEASPAQPPVAVDSTSAANSVAPASIQAATSKAIALADKIAIGAMLVGLLQVIALFTTYRVMRTSARRQLRAYVFAETFTLIDGTHAHPPQPQRAGFPGVVLTVKNSGATPAYNVRSAALVEVIEPINEEKLALAPLVNKYGTCLGPGVGLTNTPWHGRALTPGEISDVAIGAKAIYLHGRVEYEDAFAKKHFTTFRLRYTGQFPPPDAMQLNFAAEGNTAD